MSLVTDTTFGWFHKIISKSLFFQISGAEKRWILGQKPISKCLFFLYYLCNMNCEDYITAHPNSRVMLNEMKHLALGLYKRLCEIFHCVQDDNIAIF